MSVAEAPVVVSRPVSRGRRLPTLSGPVIGLLGVLGLFILLIGLKDVHELTKFLSLPNLQEIVQEQTYPAIAALGALLVIISGGIDLSVGSVLALVAVVTMQVYSLCYKGPESVPLASAAGIAAGVCAGGLCGLVNGVVITRLKVTPFVATLGMLGVARGLAYWLSGRQPLAFPAGSQPPGWVTSLQTVEASTIFNGGFWGLLVLAIGIAVLLHFTVLGRHIYAVGSNEATARLCGVSITGTKVAVYTLAGLLTGCAGIVLFAQGGSGNPSSAMGEELDVIAAVVIGGASLMGGQGTVLGALLGAFILGLLGNGVSTYDVPVEVKWILTGVIIVTSTALTEWQKRRVR